MEHIVCAAYRLLGWPADRLPYSPQFERELVPALEAAAGRVVSRREAWELISRLRKDGELPKVGRPFYERAKPVDPTLIRAYELIGVQLDQLPYSEAIDRLVRLVRETSPGLTTVRDVWLGLLNARKGRKLPRLGRSARLPIKLET